MGDAWDEQFQQCCHVLPFEMGQSLLLLLVSTQEGLRLRQSMSPVTLLTFGLYLHLSG